MLMVARVVGMGVCTDEPGRVCWWLMGVCMGVPLRRIDVVRILGRGAGWVGEVFH